jgi:hypothetical protein
MLDSRDIENMPIMSLLFQTGFLTIQSIEEGPPKEYVLGYADQYAGMRSKVFKVAVCIAGRGNVRAAAKIAQ